MHKAANQRVAPGGVVLILALLLGVWLVFQFRPQKKPEPPPVRAVPESRLQRVGLPDNPDWDGLPEFFAIVAGRAEWKDGKTRFAYWHPVMKTYSYYFEAVRDGTGFRFKEIAEPHDPNLVLEEGADGTEPIRFYHRSDGARSGPLMPDRMRKEHMGVDETPKVKVDIPLLKVPAPEAEAVPAKP